MSPLAVEGSFSPQPNYKKRPPNDLVAISFSIKPSKGISCLVNNKELKSLPFSLEAVKKIFPVDSRLYMEYDGGYDLPRAKIIEYRTETKENKISDVVCFTANYHSRSRQEYEMKIKLTSKNTTAYGTSQAVKLETAIFEIPVTNGLYTYVLVFQDENENCSYVRTRLRKKI